MRIRRLLLSCSIIITAFFICSCSKTASKDISNESADNKLTVEEEENEQYNNRSDIKLGDDVQINNDIFTEEFFDEIQKITYWNAGTAIEITSAEDIQAIYELLASLKTTMYTMTAKDAKFGYTIMDFTLSSKKVQVGLLSGDMVVDEVNYSVDKDVVDKIRTIALKNVEK